MHDATCTMAAAALFILLVLSLTLNRDAVRYTFGPIIQQELLQFASEWNNHRIRQSSMAEVPGGIPEVLYHMPHLHGQ